MKAITAIFDQIRVNGVFSKFLLSFTLLIMIPIVGLGALSYIVFADILQKEVQRYNNLVLNKTSGLIEQKIQELKNTMYQTILQTNTTGHDYSKIMDIEELLNRIKNANIFIDDIYVYYLDTDQIVGGNGLFDFDYFFKKRNENPIMDMHQWKQLLSERNNFKIIPTQNVKEASGGQKNIITFLTSFPLYGASINGTLVISVNEEKLLSIMNSIDQTEGESEIIIANSELQPISSSNKTYFTRSESAKFKQVIRRLLPDKQAGSNQYHSTVDDRQVMISYSKSTVTDWHYIVYTSLDSIMAPVKYIKMVTVAVCLALFGIGLFMAFFLSRILARPIHEIVRFIKSEFPLNAKLDRETNELRYIHEHIHFVMDSNKDLERNAERQHGLVQDYYVKSLLLGNSNLQQQNDFSSLLRYSFYRVVIIEMEWGTDCGNANLQISLKERIIHLVEQIMIDQSRVSGLLTNFGGNRLSILVNYSDEAVLLEKITETIVLTEQWIPQSKLRVTAALGNSYADIKKMNKSYEEALSAFRFRKLGETVQLVRFADAQSISTSIVYSLEQEQHIVWHVMMGDREKVAETVAVIIRSNVENVSTVEKCIKLYQAFMNTLDKIIVKSNSPQSMSDQLSAEKIVPVIFDIETYEHGIVQLFDRLSGGFQAKKHSQTDRLKQNMVQYIQDNYNKDLSLDIIADAFGLHPKYISRFFKDHVGVNFLDYLNHHRVEKAKELFQNQATLKVNQVAELVGICNLNSFIGTFKKYEGITPGRYKEHLMKTAL